MRRKRVWTTGFFILIGIAGCINYNLLPKEEPLTGQTYLDAPLDNAKITVETTSGNAINTSNGTTTQGRFFEQLSLTSPLFNEDISSYSAYLPLTVSVTGGTCDGETFDGILLGYLTSFSSDNSLHVNILTTLIVKYKQTANVSFEEAEAAVKTCLGIPVDVDLKNSLNNPNLWNHFDPARFMALAEENGGFDALVDLVVANMIDSQESGFALKASSTIASIASKAADKILDGVGKGIGKGLTEEALGWILGAFGVEDPTEAALNEISETLDEMNATLTNIESEIATLTDEVSELLALVQLEWDDLISKYDSLNMSESENIIQNQYNNMLGTFTTSSDKLCTADGNALALKFAQQILGDYVGVNYDIDQQIYNMYANIVGKTPGSNGALYDLTSELVDRVKAGEDLFDCYLTLENYFGQLVAIQTQGLELVIEAIHMTENTTGYDGLTSFVGSDTEYYNKFRGQIDEEVEMFLVCVDRLIVTQIDVRSEIAQKFAYLSSETAETYGRTDFIATKLSTEHPAGLIVRLIGDPTHVSDWVTNNQIQVNDQDIDVVTVSGETINSYAPVLPSTTPSDINYYLEWSLSNNVYSFRKETQVSIAKLHYTADSAASFSVTSPDNTQTLDVDWYDDDYQQADADDNDVIAYGNGVFYVRVLPTWREGTATESDDKKDMYTSSWTPDLDNASINLYSEMTDERTWKNCKVTYVADILSTICNSEDDDVTLKLNWNGTLDLDICWNSSAGTPSGGARQYFKCQSTQQDTKSDSGDMTFNVTLSPNTNTDIDYKAKHYIDSYAEYFSKHANGSYLETNIWLNSMEIIPQE